MSIIKSCTRWDTLEDYLLNILILIGQSQFSHHLLMGRRMEPLKSHSCVGNFRNCGQSAHFSRHILLQTRAMKTTSLQNAGRTISPSLHVPKQCTNNYKRIKYDIFCSCFLLFYSNSFLVSDPRVATIGILADALRINNIILLFVKRRKYVYSTDFRRVFGFI